MVSNIGQIKNPQIFIEPSRKLENYIKTISSVSEETPVRIKNFILKNKLPVNESIKINKLDYVLTEEDKEFISCLNLPEEIAPLLLNHATKHDDQEEEEEDPTKNNKSTLLLTLPDIHWIYNYLNKENQQKKVKVYLHEILEDSKIILPKNEEIPRNSELEKRCRKLKAEQQNREYQNMTKNVDNFRRKLPEDTIGYQLKMMNAHLIAVFQFIISVFAGFAFGFIGIELLFGNLDFGFRLLLGIICALVIALADLYFLAKKLNEDLEFETQAKKIPFTDSASESKKMK